MADIAIARRIVDRYNAACVEGDINGYQFSTEYLRKHGLTTE
jgi:hypothetical protein